MMHYKCASHHGGPESHQKMDVKKYEANTLMFDLKQHPWKHPSNHPRRPKLSHPDDLSQPSTTIPAPQHTSECNFTAHTKGAACPNPQPRHTIQQSNLVSLEVINFVTNCVWAKALDIYTLNKLKPKQHGLNLEQVAMPIFHPTTGEAISRYKKLIHDPATSEIWQMAFGKDFGGMAQGNNKTGQKGTNSIFVNSHAEIPHIPKSQTVTYACVVVDF
jgi:hypothetical protein